MTGSLLPHLVQKLRALLPECDARSLSGCVWALGKLAYFPGDPVRPLSECNRSTSSPCFGF